MSEETRHRFAETIRAATEVDADAIAMIHVEGWRAAYAGILPDDFLAQLSIPKRAEFWKREIASGKNFVRVAVHDGTLLGWISGGPSRDDDASDALEIYALYVSPHSWRRGLGRRLMNAALQEFARPKAPITLWVLEKNQPALEFYRTLAFSADGAVKEISIGGSALREIRLSRQPFRHTDGEVAMINAAPTDSGLSSRQIAPMPGPT